MKDVPGRSSPGWGQGTHVAACPVARPHREAGGLLVSCTVGCAAWPQLRIDGSLSSGGSFRSSVWEAPAHHGVRPWGDVLRVLLCRGDGPVRAIRGGGRSVVSGFCEHSLSCTPACLRWTRGPASRERPPAGAGSLRGPRIRAAGSLPPRPCLCRCTC